MEVLLILLAGSILYCLKKVIQKKRYKQTDYYKQTHNSFNAIQCDKGIRGEFLTWKYLQKLSGYQKYLFNCYLPKDNGETTEIDIVLLHESGIYVFESKNYSGWIFGDETQQYWTQCLSKGKGKFHEEHFFNPIIQNKVHLKWLCKYLGMDFSHFYSYIVFSDRCTLKDITLTSGQHFVINRYKVLHFVKENAKSSLIRLTPDEIDNIYAKLYPLTQVSKKIKSKHAADVDKKKKSRIAFYENPRLQQEICPLCGRELILRTASKGKYAGKSFFGCSSYPQCKYIKNVESCN